MSSASLFTKPEKYRLELDTDSGRTMAASIGAIDVVNDLALVTVGRAR